MSEYHVPIPYPSYIQRDREVVVSLAVWLGDQVVAPSSGTYTLLDSAGTTISTGAVTVLADRSVSYTIAAASTASKQVSKGYQERWTLTMPQGERVFIRSAVLTIHRIAPVIGYQDLSRVRAIADNLDEPATQIPGFIDEAWSRVLGFLEGQGSIAHLIITPHSLREAHLLLAEHLAYEVLAGCAGGGAAEARRNEADRKLSQYEAALQRLNFRYDEDRTGLDNGDTRTPAVCVLQTAPRRTTRWNIPGLSGIGRGR